MFNIFIMTFRISGYTQYRLLFYHGFPSRSVMFYSIWLGSIISRQTYRPETMTSRTRALHTHCTRKCLSLAIFRHVDLDDTRSGDFSLLLYASRLSAPMSRDIDLDTSLPKNTFLVQMAANTCTRLVVCPDHSDFSKRPNFRTSARYRGFHVRLRISKKISLNLNQGYTIESIV